MTVHRPSSVTGPVPPLPPVSRQCQPANLTSDSHSVFSPLAVFLLHSNAILRNALRAAAAPPSSAVVPGEPPRASACNLNCTKTIFAMQHVFRAPTFRFFIL